MNYLRKFSSNYKILKLKRTYKIHIEIDDIILKSY